MLRMREPRAQEAVLSLLAKDWPHSCVSYWSRVSREREGSQVDGSQVDGGGCRMRSKWLPLLQQDQVVACELCDRIVVLDKFEAHQASCRKIFETGGGLGGAHGRGRTAVASRQLKRPPLKGRGQGKRDKAADGAERGSSGKRGSSLRVADAPCSDGQPLVEHGLPDASMRGTEVITTPQPDLRWIAEYTLLLSQLPSMQEAIDSSLRGDKKGWPRPMPIDALKPKPRRLWGLPEDMCSQASPHARAATSNADSVSTTSREHATSNVSSRKRAASGDDGFVNGSPATRQTCTPFPSLALLDEAPPFMPLTAQL